MNDSVSIPQILSGAEHYLRALPVQVPEPLCLALAAELAQDFHADALLAFARRAGVRWAVQFTSAFGHVESMADLIALLNDYWASLHWGWVEMEEHPNHLLLRHHLLPLARSYGVEHLGWSVGFVEGFYEEIFRRFGADDSVQVRLGSDIEDTFSMQFRVTA